MNGFTKIQRPERFIQFGEGGFLRGFADWMIYKMNEKADLDSSVVVVQPIREGLCDLLTSQDCLYTHLIPTWRGMSTARFSSGT